MIGDAVPVRFSRRLCRKPSLSPIKLSPRKKVRLAIKARKTSGLNSSVRISEETKVGRRGKSKKNSKQAARNLKQGSVTLKATSQTKTSKILEKKNQTKNLSNKTSSRNLFPELYGKNKVVKKNFKKSTNLKQSDCRSLCLLESSQSNKRKNGNLNKIQTPNLNSKAGLITPNPGKTIHISSYPDRRKSARLLSKPLNGSRSPGVSECMLTPLVPKKVTQTCRYSKNNKSVKLTKESIDSKTLVPEVSFHSSASKSFLETPSAVKVLLTSKHSVIRKSSAFEKFNQDSSLSTPVPIGRRNRILVVNKSKSSTELLLKSRSIKQNNCKLSDKNISTDSHEKLKENTGQQQIHCSRKSATLLAKETPANFKKPFLNETENLFLDCLVATPASKLVRSRSTSKKYLSKSNSRSSNRKLDILTTKSHVASEKLSSKSFLETPSLMGGTGTSKLSDRKNFSRLQKPNSLKTLNQELSLSTSEPLLRKNSNSLENKPTKSHKGIEIPPLENPGRKRGNFRKSNKKTNFNSHEKLKRNTGQPQKYSCRKSSTLLVQDTSETFKKPFSNETEIVLLDDLIATPVSKPEHSTSNSKKCLRTSDSLSSNKKLDILSAETRVANENLPDARKRKKSADVSVAPAKGTIKRKRWLLNKLTENTEGYEDDMFESQYFNLHKPTFHFGDESDGSSVNIATPKFDRILTPALPKKTPRFKDCISPTELLQARKTAEEYLYRRNKKRKSGERPPSGKKMGVKENETSLGSPEKQKLNFEEAVNKLLELQKNSEREAEIDNEEEDSYFSDVSN